MGFPTVQFLGRSFQIPGSYAAFRTKTAKTSLSPDLNTLVLAGASDNGWFFGDSSLPETQRYMEFSSFAEAKAVLGSGDLLDAIKASFSPSKDSRFASGPALIRALNISRNTAASASAPNSASGTYPVTHVIPGKKGNEVRFRVSQSGAKLEVGDATGIQSATGLDATDISLVYTGDGQATFSYDGTAFAVALTGQTDATLPLSIAPTEGMTIGDLVDLINSSAGYQATVQSAPDVLVANLDHYSGINAAVAVSIKAQLWRQAQVIFNYGNANVVITGARKPLTDTLSFIYLSGGATVAPQPADWSAAVDALEFVKGFYVSFCTAIPGVVASLWDRALNGLTPDGSDERFVTAGALKATDFDTRIADAKNLNGEIGCYGCSPVELYRADGLTLKTFDCWMLGVLHNAGKAATNVRESMLYKDLNVNSLPEKLSKTQIKKALAAGALIADLKPNGGAAKITSDCTTYQKNDLIRNKAQTICLAMAMIKDLRESLQNQFLGETPTDPDAFGTSFTDSDIRTFVENKFDFDYIRNYGWLTRNIYTGEAAWDRKFTISRDGNAIWFVFPDGKSVTSIDFIFSLLNLDVVRGSSAA